jgi:hypothetical protein
MEGTGLSLVMAALDPGIQNIDWVWITGSRPVMTKDVS